MLQKLVPKSSIEKTVDCCVDLEAKLNVTISVYLTELPLPVTLFRTNSLVSLEINAYDPLLWGSCQVPLAWVWVWVWVRGKVSKDSFEGEKEERKEGGWGEGGYTCMLSSYTLQDLSLNGGTRILWKRYVNMTACSNWNEGVVDNHSYDSTG